MDRRQRKTREAILQALTQLLSRTDFHHITVEAIIAAADIGRATFYAHFASKDLLLEALCEELFCHIFDAVDQTGHAHRHIFDCDAPDSIFLHLFQHLQKNDNHILELLSSQNNELFLRYFKSHLAKLIDHPEVLSATRQNPAVPDSLWKHHIASTFISTLQWWIENGRQESPETIATYFLNIL